MAWLLDFYGFEVILLDGGYKAYRQMVLQSFTLPIKFNVLFLPYTKKHPHKMTTWIDLYKLISSSWLTMSCCLVSEILVAKYFEIGLCGSVICGDYPSQEDELFIKNNMILLDKNMTDSEIIGVIQNALSDKNKLKMYSENLKKYISEKYMYKNGLELFESYIQNAITE
jgi:hypothetical protein